MGADFHAEEVPNHSYMLPELGDLPSPLPSNAALASALASAKPAAIVTSSNDQNAMNTQKPAFEVTHKAAYGVSYVGHHAGIDSSYYHQAPALTVGNQGIPPIQHVMKPAPTVRSVTDEHTCAAGLGGLGADLNAEDVSSHSCILPELGALPPPMPAMMPVQNSTAPPPPPLPTAIPVHNSTTDMFVESPFSEDAYSQQRMGEHFVTGEETRSKRGCNISHQEEYAYIHHV